MDKVNPEVKGNIPVVTIVKGKQPTQDWKAVAKRQQCKRLIISVEMIITTLTALGGQTHPENSYQRNIRNEEILLELSGEIEIPE